jgi:hypothetical protein
VPFGREPSAPMERFSALMASVTELPRPLVQARTVESM